MKRIAFFVEGETELAFIEKLLREVAGRKNIVIRSVKLVGGSQSSPRITQILAIPSPALEKAASYEALIYVSGADNRIVSDILERHKGLEQQNFTKIVGLRDLRGKQNDRFLTHNDLPNLERAFKVAERRCLPLYVKIVVAVMEIEAWFLAETNHYECIDSRLTQAKILANISKIGFNPYQDNLTLRLEPAEDLAEIYQLVGKNYSKKRRGRERTTNCLDYANVYLGLVQKITQLNELITEIDEFLT